jgi:hypothetical protein
MLRMQRRSATIIDGKQTTENMGNTYLHAKVKYHRKFKNYMDE